MQLCPQAYSKYIKYMYLYANTENMYDVPYV
jgi:hypothetical protein